MNIQEHSNLPRKGLKSVFLLLFFLEIYFASCISCRTLLCNFYHNIHFLTKIYLHFSREKILFFKHNFKNIYECYFGNHIHLHSCKNEDNINDTSYYVV